MRYYIYKVTNQLTGTFYIGKHRQSDTEDFMQYIGSSSHEDFKLSKYPRKYFVKEVLEELDNYEDLGEREKFFIGKYINDPFCVNKSVSSNGGDSFYRDMNLNFKQISKELEYQDFCSECGKVTWHYKNGKCKSCVAKINYDNFETRSYFKKTYKDKFCEKCNRITRWSGSFGKASNCSSCYNRKGFNLIRLDSGKIALRNGTNIIVEDVSFIHDVEKVGNTYYMPEGLQVADNKSETRVEALIKNEQIDNWLRLVFYGTKKDMLVTEDHVFITENSDFVKARDLKIGDVLPHVYSKGIKRLPIKDIQKIERVADSYDVETESGTCNINNIWMRQCRTRLAANYHNPSMNGQSLGRGNISFITINLPYLALEAARWYVGSNLVGDLRKYLKEDRSPEVLEKFKELLYGHLDVCAELLLRRLNIVGQRPISSQQMMMMNGIWTAKSLGRPLDLDEIPEDELRNLCPDFSEDQPIEDVYEFAYLNNKLPRVPYKPSDKQLEIIKDGSLSIGFCGLAECLYVLCGNHHGETEEAQELGLEIVGIMNDYCIERSEKERLNYSLFASPAESTASRFAEAIVKEFGYIEGTVQKEEGSTDYYITNSNHIPVNFPISISRKIDLEAPYHALCSAGDICYVELDGDASNNIDALERIVNHMKESGVGYGAINVPVDEDPVCGYVGVIDKVCPRCGRCVPN